MPDSMQRMAVLGQPGSQSRFRRAIDCYRRGGTAYVWHKSMRRLLGNDSPLKRKLLYSHPRDYWTLRGGAEYMAEQEGQPSRTARSQWLSERVAACSPESILEVGCGYGKQLEAIRSAVGDHIPLTGIDFSPTQLRLAAERLADVDHLTLVLGDGQRLPFPDGAFDLVLTSAVILHNEPEIADRMRAEIVRVSRRWCVHNEDTDETYNRYGYDTAAWYRHRGLEVIESGPIPESVFSASDDPDGESSRSQYCLARPR
ncbi:methyltransferase domain-containing protein [bacterium]|nr:methyltransferase domain-containing protein [bacterium]